MKLGKAFEILVKHILINVGFSEVQSDGLYVFDGTPGQMIQGLGEAHNADVLLEPPVQTPFYFRTRLLIECKDYSEKTGLNIVRGVYALREDINHFNIVERDDLIARRCQNRPVFSDEYDRFSYQVAIASTSGFSIPAQYYATAYRIPLIEFNRLPFWNEYCEMLGYKKNIISKKNNDHDQIISLQISEEEVIQFANKIGQKMAIAITNSGQMLFLYSEHDNYLQFDEYYSLYWTSPTRPWTLVSGTQSYAFQLPDSIMKQWLSNATNDLEMKKEALNCKASFFSNMIVYYVEHARPIAKMISIDKYGLERAKKELEQHGELND